MFIQEIALDSAFNNKVLDGTKTTTVRPGRRDYRLEPTRLGSIAVRVVEVAYMSLERALRFYRTDGFEKAEDLLQTLREFYPGLGLDEEVTVVTFELMR